jgi:hypothetical protein
MKGHEGRRKPSFSILVQLCRKVKFPAASRKASIAQHKDAVQVAATPANNLSGLGASSPLITPWQGCHSFRGKPRGILAYVVKLPELSQKNAMGL